MKTKFHKDVAWLEPYMMAIKDLVPVERIKQVRGFRVSVDKEILTDASIIRATNNKSFVINMRTHSNYMHTHIQKYEFIAEILINFAHECSHLVYWDHTSDHFKLQAKIMTRFAKVMKKLKVEDTYKRIDQMG